MKHLSLLILTAVILTGCRGGDEEEGALEIFPHQSPARLGQMWPLGDEAPDPGTSERVPFEWVLLLQTASTNIEIEEVCIVGSDQFSLEGPVPAVPTRDEDAALRVTYDRTEPGPADMAAVVVQSNAENFPTLVVPVCAQVVPEGEERVVFDCVSPIQVAEGTRDDSACN